MAPSCPRRVPESHWRAPSAAPSPLLAENLGAVYRPSIWPRINSPRSEACSMKTENLMLDEPAFSTNIASFMPALPHPLPLSRLAPGEGRYLRPLRIHGREFGWSRH